MTENTASGGGSSRELLSDGQFLVIIGISLAGTMGNNVVYPAIPGVQQSLEVPSSRIGLIITVYTLPTLFMVPVVGPLADTYGRRLVILPSLLLFSVSGSAIAFTDSFAQILVLRGIQGIAVAGVLSLSVTLLGDLYEGPKGTTAQGLRTAANNINGFILPFLVGILSAVAWNYPFLLYTIPFVAFIGAYIYLPSTTADPGDERRDDQDTSNYVREILTEVRDRRLLLLLPGEGVRDFVKYALLTFVPIFAVQTLGATFVQAGAILSIRGVAGIIISPNSGHLVSILSHRQALSIALCISAVSLLLVPFAPDITVLAVIVGVYGVGDAILSPVLKDGVTTAASHEYRAGVVSGMMTIKKLGQSASPAIFGIVLSLFGFSSLFVSAGTFAVIYAVLLTLFLPTTR